RPDELAAAAAEAPADEPFHGLALLRAALKSEVRPDRRADLITTAFRIGAQHTVLPLVAHLFANEAAALRPEPGWSNWASTMASRLLRAGPADAAERWYPLIDASAPAMGVPRSRIAIALALLAPNPANLDRAQMAMSGLVAEPGVNMADAALLI